MSSSQLLPLEHTLVGGKYRLGQMIGSGGVGTVYRATHLWTERDVAVKVLNPSLPHIDQVREAFLREARATVQLEHPSVVDVLDMGEDDAGTTYMVMELLEGPTLRDLLLERGSLSTDETAAVLWPLMEALETAHDLGIVHKDFKPENIILSVDGFGGMTPKLLDFGVAQILPEGEPAGAGNSTHQVIVGTPEYMSPEQARHQRQLIGPQTDVWGVGVVWYECLAGRCPFNGDTPLEVLEAVCEAPLDFQGVPDSQAPVLRQALEREPSKRTPSLARLRAELERAGVTSSAPPTDGYPISSRPPSRERPSYVRPTLRGTGPESRTKAGVRFARLPSALIKLLSVVRRRAAAAVGGLALAVAVALATWWGTGARSGDQAVPASATKTDTQMSGAKPSSHAPAEPRSPVISPDPVGVASAPPEPEKGAVAGGRLAEPETVEAAPKPGGPESSSAGATAPSPATKPRPTTPKSRGAKSRPRPSAPQDYRKPPNLVTQW